MNSSLGSLSNFSPSTIALIIYGAIAIVGGIIGFTKSQSKASIISGSISGTGLLVAGIAAAQSQAWGKIAGMAIAALLIIVFVVRLIKTKKFMPAGLMILGGVATLGIAILSS
ncbi:MAG: TMEM14 family protein [Pseudanabaenaceae cyanobacterium bins.39]|nr:TMEM14 family protein [Pseudanabaenaceae cyanobacterium bins.39]